MLVYRHDPRFPEKQVAATTRPPTANGPSLLTPGNARLEAEELLSLFPVLYPNDSLVRLALRGAAAYGLSWFDAHLWAYAEYHALPVLYSEDFQHGRLYGTVRVVDPFREIGAES